MTVRGNVFIQQHFAEPGDALAELKIDGGMLERQLELLKAHVAKGCSLNVDSLEGVCYSLSLTRVVRAVSWLPQAAQVVGWSTSRQASEASRLGHSRLVRGAPEAETLRNFASLLLKKQ